MTTTETGRQAEDLVARELKKRGFKILNRNWRTRWCEIDIIVEKQKVVYFVEVKYRKNTRFGDGLDAITPKKQQQMAFAAELWVAENNYNGYYQLMAASVEGVPPIISRLVDI